MTTVNLRQWIKLHIGSVADAAGWKFISLPTGAVSIVGFSGGTVIIESVDTVLKGEQHNTFIFIGDEDDNGVTGCFDVLPIDASANRIFRVISNALERQKLKEGTKKQNTTLRRKDYELRELIEIGKSLSACKDLDKLLNEILSTSRKLIGADAGSIYLVEGEDDDIAKKKLRFKFSQNDSLEIDSEEFIMPVSVTSIAGAAAVMKQSIDIPNARSISPDASYKFDDSWDKLTGYNTISILAVPMINQVGEVLGVIQLINKKRNPAIKLLSSDDFSKEVIAVDSEGKALLETLASQAGVAMENAQLYEEIKNIFDGFIRASVFAIEQRDPTTSGHSFRVAKLTRRLAEVVSEYGTGKYANTHFTKENLREIETAALLHDFGKVGVREEVLGKAKKLYPPNLKIIKSRIDFIRRSIENDHLQRRLMMLEAGTPGEELAILDQARKRAVDDIDECWGIIFSANEPTVLAKGDFAKVEDVASRTYFDLDGKRKQYLETKELESLLVAKGSLTSEELDEIRSHVSHTIDFLKRIPWGKSMRNIPAFAGGHHENINGTGYPNGLKSDEIPIPSKIMAVADIYDALTAADRPYKKAVSKTRALQILGFEAKSNHIDTELLEIFEKYNVCRVLDEK